MKFPQTSNHAWNNGDERPFYHWHSLRWKLLPMKESNCVRCYSFQNHFKSCTVIGIFMFSHLCLKRTAINWFQKPFVCIVGWRKVSTLPSCNRFKIAAFHWKVKVFSYLLWNKNVVSNSNLNPKLNLEVA